MKSIFKPVLVAVLLAGAGFVAVTQVQAAGEPGGMLPGMHGGAGHHMGSSDQMNPAKMQARHNKHMAALKAKLKLSATQESEDATIFFGTPFQNVGAYKCAIIAKGQSNWSKSV